MFQNVAVTPMGHRNIRIYAYLHFFISNKCTETLQNKGKLEATLPDKRMQKRHQGKNLCYRDILL